jgi:hypothetical protein
MSIWIRLSKDVGTEDTTGIEIVSASDYAELLRQRLQAQYPDCNVDVESTYDLGTHITVDGFPTGQDRWVENTIAHIRDELWQECLDAYTEDA